MSEVDPAEREAILLAIRATGGSVIRVARASGFDLERVKDSLSLLEGMGYIRLWRDGSVLRAGLLPRGQQLIDGETGPPIGLALGSCYACQGTGWCGPRLRTWRPRERVCHCVYRRVFGVCWARYREIAATGGGAARMEIGASGYVASLVGAEYLADCLLVARRTLSPYPLERAVFETHIVGGLAWAQSVVRLARMGLLLSRGNFFHAVYRAQQRVGQAYLEERLMPREYFMFRPVQFQGSQWMGGMPGMPG
jgi:hypothetical protein